METVELVPTVARFFPQTQLALREAPVSHRSEAFSTIFRATQERLQQLSGTRFDAVFACGSGTWANELMIWTFAPAAKKVLVLNNGEFGERLAAQVRACRNDALTLDFGFGEKMTASRINAFLDEQPSVELIFCVACETSWGGTSDLAMLDRIARERKIDICLDAMSAFAFTPEIFTLPSIVAIAASSGKGLAALPGIALLFFEKNYPIPDVPRPETLNLKAYVVAAENNMPRNTLSSVVLKTVHAALGEILSLGSDNYRSRLLEIKKRIIRRAGAFGVRVFPHSDSPMITAFCRDANAEKFLDAIREHGYSAYTQPAYLKEKKLFEIAVMGNFYPQDFSDF